jgi:hypothetical protein
LPGSLLSAYGATVATVAVALVKDESRDSFDALFQGLEKIRERIGAPKPQVVITDKDERQRDALFEIWPDVQQQLCRYHMNVNVALQSKKKFKYPEEPQQDGNNNNNNIRDGNQQRQDDEA